MKIVLITVAILFSVIAGKAQDIFTRGLVYQVPEMKKVIVKENRPFNAGDTVLTFDIYYPPGFTFKTSLPVILFNNGVGSLELPRWGIYKDWARLAAANGLVAVNHQSRNGKALADDEALLDYLVSHAGELNIDPGKIGLWTCSANARTGMRMAYKTKPDLIKALVIYYGGPDSLGQLRQNLPTLMVRAGLDAQFINTGIDNFIQASLQQDTRLEVINYLEGIHAFDAFTHTSESKEIVIRTIQFFKKNLNPPVTNNAFILTNKNFMWLVMNNQLSKAIIEFRNARQVYRADSTFQPFYNAVIREDVLNANAYWLVNNRRPIDALDLFKLAVESYPESPNANESLSEAYEITGNKGAAIQYAKLCLQKLSQATGLNEDFRQRIRRAAQERIRRLEGS